jgi:hypothetical protein
MFDLSYLTTKPNQTQQNPNPPPAAPSGIPAEASLDDESRRSGLPATKPDPKPPITPVIQALPCGCRINTTTRTMHFPCDAHKRCRFCSGTDLVFNSKSQQVPCPCCGIKTTKGTFRR